MFIRAAYGGIRPSVPLAFQRFASTTSEALTYSEHGHYSRVLKKETQQLDSPTDGSVLVKLLAAPVNPADFNAIAGNYATLPTLPAVAGNEGVGVIEEVGPNVKGLKVGDHVVPKKTHFGTWRTHAIASESDLFSVPSTIKPEYASALSVNPCTAVRLLSDFEKLSEGDVIIQNGANSTVGQLVAQIAHSRGIKTINVVRNGPLFNETVDRMKAYGADIVVNEEYLRTPEFKRLTSDLPAPAVAFNGVGGRSATDIARTLREGGKFVTYGGMSGHPVQLPTSLFLFKNISCHGFLLSNWVKENGDAKHQALINEVAQMVDAGKLNFWMETHKFADYEIALAAAESPSRNRKIILTME